jgi:hypothetical protein
MKVNEIVYYCLDAIKAFSDDSYVNEDHIVFLLGKYRGALLQQYHNIKKLIPDSNYQIICLTLTPTDSIPCTSGPVLKSVEEIPSLMPIGSPSLFLFNGFESENIVFVPFPRLKAVGFNKWKKNFIYVAIGPDNHLYLSSSNPQAKYLETLRLKGLFEDFEKASELECDGEGKPCDEMERNFPLEVALIPDLIARVVKDALGMAYRPSDPHNNAMDDLADIASYVRQNMKKSYRDLVEGNE